MTTMGFVGRLIPLLAAALTLAAPVSNAAGEPAAPSPGPFEQVGEVEGELVRNASPFDSEGRAFFTVTAGGARVWDAATFKPLTQVLPHEHIWIVGLAAAGKTLFTSGPNEVRVWDVATSKLLSATQVARKTTEHFAASPDGTRFVTIDRADDEKVAVWRTGRAQPALFLPHNTLVGTADFDPAGKRIVTHALFSGFHVWSAETGRELYPPVESDDYPMNPGRALFNVDGTRLLVARWSGFTIVDADTGRLLVDVRFEGLLNTGQLRYSGDGVHVAVGMLDWNNFTTVRVYEAATGRLVREFGKDMYECQIGPDERRAWCSTVGKDPRNLHEVWDLETGKLVQTIRKAGDAAMSPDGTTVLVPLAHGFKEPAKTAVWRLRKGEPGTAK